MKKKEKKKRKKKFRFQAQARRSAGPKWQPEWQGPCPLPCRYYVGQDVGPSCLQVAVAADIHPICVPGVFDKNNQVAPAQISNVVHAVYHDVVPLATPRLAENAK